MLLAVSKKWLLNLKWLLYWGISKNTGQKWEQDLSLHPHCHKPEITLELKQPDRTFFTGTHNKLLARLSLALHHGLFSHRHKSKYIQIHKAVDFARLKSTASYLQQRCYVSTPQQSPLRSTGHSSYLYRLVHFLASSSSSSSCCEITCIGSSN